MSDVPPRLLRETLRGAMTPGSAPSCLDTETLAAWSDGTLSARERTAVESHAADCARCQALLAAMTRTMPPAPQRTWWRSSAFNWLVPLAVAATAVVVWINVDTSRSERFAAAQPAPAAAAATPPDSAPAATAPTAATDRLASTDAKRESDQSSPASAVAPRRALPAAGERRDAGGSRARQFDATARAEADAAPKELRETVPVSPPAGSPPAVAAPAQPAPPPPAEAPRADASPQAAAGAAPQANIAAPLALRAPARAMLDASASTARGQAFGKAAAVPFQIVSPDPNVRWRIVTAGSVDRSVDGGTTWQTQSTGVPVLLAAGAAPSPAICWLVGSGGTIVLSRDGRSWQRVAFREEIDLISIRASDAVNAAVTAADGRTFATGDGGKTWRPAGIRQ